jgi:alpha-glucosidase
VDRNFSIDQIPVYVKAGAILPMQPPARYTSEKPADPLIVSVWPLKPGMNSSYSVYEDSGASVEYQNGVYARTPIKASQERDALRVEIGPVEGSYPGMARTRSYELRLPADWPPASVTANDSPISQAGASGKHGWRFEGNTLTTVIPVSASSLDEKVIVEVHRADGLTARRGELDGFAGAMTRLRGAYDSMHQTGFLASPPDILIDAMQSGDRLGYHPEKATAELAHFHEVLPKAQSAVESIGQGFPQKMDDAAKHIGNNHPPDLDAAKQHVLDAMTRAQRLAGDAGK